MRSTRASRFILGIGVVCVLASGLSGQTPLNPNLHEPHGPAHAQGGLASRPPAIVAVANADGSIDVCWANIQNNRAASYEKSDEKWFTGKRNWYYSSDKIFLHRINKDLSSATKLKEILPKDGASCMLVGFAKDGQNAASSNHYILASNAEYMNGPDAVFQGKLEDPNKKTIHNNPQQKQRTGIAWLEKLGPTGKSSWTRDLNSFLAPKHPSRSNPWPLYGTMNAGTGRLSVINANQETHILGLFTRRDFDLTYGDRVFHQGTSYVMFRGDGQPIFRVSGNDSVSHAWDQRIMFDSKAKSFVLLHNHEHLQRTITAQVVPFSKPRPTASDASAYNTMGIWLLSPLWPKQLEARFKSIRADSKASPYQYCGLIADIKNGVVHVAMATADGMKSIKGLESQLPQAAVETKFEQELFNEFNDVVPNPRRAGARFAAEFMSNRETLFKSRFLSTIRAKNALQSTKTSQAFDYGTAYKFPVIDKLYKSEFLDGVDPNRRYKLPTRKPYQLNIDNEGFKFGQDRLYAQDTLIHHLCEPRTLDEMKNRVRVFRPEGDSSPRYVGVYFVPGNSDKIDDAQAHIVVATKAGLENIKKKQLGKVGNQSATTTSFQDLLFNQIEYLRSSPEGMEARLKSVVHGDENLKHRLLVAHLSDGRTNLKLCFDPNSSTDLAAYLLKHKINYWYQDQGKNFKATQREADCDNYAKALAESTNPSTLAGVQYIAVKPAYDSRDAYGKIQREYNKLCRRYAGWQAGRGAKRNGVHYFQMPIEYKIDQRFHAGFHSLHARGIHVNDTFLHLGGAATTATDDYLVVFAESTGGNLVDAPHNLKSILVKPVSDAAWKASDSPTNPIAKRKQPMKALTNYAKGSTALSPKLVKVDDTTFIVIWEKWTQNANSKWTHASTWAVKLDGKGTAQGKAVELAGKPRLTRGDDAFLQEVGSNNYACWITGNGSNLIVHRVAANGLKYEAKKVSIP